MELDYSTKGEAIITMNRFIEDALEDFPEDEWVSALCPVRYHIFKVNANGKPLDTKRALLFHCFVANLIFISKRARPNIQPVISYITTRVREPDEDDWKKLRRLLQYLFGTMENIVIHLNADDLNDVHWWVD